MVATDGKEIVFAGAGIVWGATTFVRGLIVWRAGHKLTAPSSYSLHSSTVAKGSFPTSVIAGFALTLACIAYLSLSLLGSLR